jgi:hypothetical protein
MNSNLIDSTQLTIDVKIHIGAIPFESVIINDEQLEALSSVSFIRKFSSGRGKFSNINGSWEFGIDIEVLRERNLTLDEAVKHLFNVSKSHKVTYDIGETVLYRKDEESKWIKAEITYIFISDQYIFDYMLFVPEYIERVSSIDPETRLKKYLVE